MVKCLCSSRLREVVGKPAASWRSWDMRLCLRGLDLIEAGEQITHQVLNIPASQHAVASALSAQQHDMTLSYHLS